MPPPSTNELTDRCGLQPPEHTYLLNMGAYRDSVRNFDWARYDAVLFDLDGVITPTASIHALAWKRTFDIVLAEWSEARGITQDPFDLATDYRLYVDGRPRFDGVATFLASRGIDLPGGDPDDPPGLETVSAVGNMKNQLVNEILAREGVEAYPGSVALIAALAEQGMRMAVVSASANASAVLAAAGVADYFTDMVDGVVATALGLRGKPEPDPFLEASRRLDVEPGRAVVVEDAVAGIQAGVAGGFGAVIGVDRHSDPATLTEAGATLVVSDLGELVP